MALGELGGAKSQELEDFLRLYLDFILKYFKHHKIILHKAYLLDAYVDSQGDKQYFTKNVIINNEKVNKILKFMYDYVEAYIKNIKVIDISSKYLACENHKWGLAPMHYQQQYYKEAAEILTKYMKL